MKYKYMIFQWFLIEYIQCMFRQTYYKIIFIQTAKSTLGVNLIDSINYFGSASSDLIKKDFTRTKT